MRALYSFTRKVPMNTLPTTSSDRSNDFKLDSMIDMWITSRPFFENFSFLADSEINGKDEQAGTPILHSQQRS